MELFLLTERLELVALTITVEPPIRDPLSRDDLSTKDKTITSKCPLFRGSTVQWNL